MSDLRSSGSAALLVWERGEVVLAGGDDDDGGGVVAGVSRCMAGGWLGELVDGGLVGGCWVALLSGWPGSGGRLFILR